MVFVAIFVIALAVFAGVLVAFAQLRHQAAASQAAAVAAAVAAVTQQTSSALADERDKTVDTVLSMANDKLTGSMAAGSRELDLRSQGFEKQVTDLTAQLHHMNQVVEDLRRDSSAKHGQLVENLQAVTQTNTALASTTQSLRDALASPKARGQWGERMAEDVLRAAGFKEHINFRRQRALESGSIPDIAFLLPGELEVRMDVKFPVDNYLRVLEAEIDGERDRYTKAFVRDVRARMKELAKRDYIDARDTVDCVLMFIPNEAVYGFLHQADPALLDDAQAQKIVLCSPSSLLAVLAVIRQAVDHFQLERTSDEILRCLGGVTEQWSKFADQLDTVGKRLETLTKGWDDLQGTRRRVFEKQLDAVDRLRADHGLTGPVASGELLVASRQHGTIRSLPLASGD